MNETTKGVLVGILRHFLTIGAGGLASHGIINANATETVVSIGIAGAGVGWSIWDKYGRTIVLSQLEVWKAKALAQQEALSKARVPAPSNAQIAASIPDPKITAGVVADVTEKAA